jgi:orotate phosphoribosyltransferase
MLEQTRRASAILDLMETSGALLSGHFELASGLHSEKYIQCALLLEDPVRAEQVGKELARELEEILAGSRPDVVVSPAVGGLIIGHEVARALGTRSLFAERLSGRMTLRRGFSIKKGERAVVIEDVFTTGGSIKEVIEIIRERGGEVMAVGSIVNRGINVDFGVPAAYLVRAEIENHEPAVCPLCGKGIEVVKPGSKRLQTGGG